jgi:putative RecB family exonuclease
MPIYSYSRLSTFDQCPLKFKYQYKDRIKPEIGESVEAFMGSRVHEVMEKLYSDLKLQKRNSLDDLLAYYKKIWDAKWYDEIEIRKNGFKEQDYFNTGKKCIENYYKRYKPFEEITLGVEKRIMIKLDPQGQYLITGKIDRVTQVKPGEYEIHDYKTSTSSVPSQEIINRDRQLALYHIGIQKEWPDAKKVCLVWHYVAFDREMKACWTSKALERLEKETLEAIKRIEATQDFPAKKSPLCDWCGYRNICPQWKHIYKIQDLSEKQYLSEPGYNLVNQYADLRLKKQDFIKRVDEELEQLEKAIFNFSEKEKIDIVRGKDHKIRIKVQEKIKFPSKTAKERKMLNKILQESGKWIEVSDLDAIKLTRLVKEEKLNKDLLSKIQQFQTLEKTKTIFLSKLETKNGQQELDM